MVQFYRIGEAAKRLGVCAKTLRRWDAAGKVHCFRTVGGHRRIARSELDRLRNSRGAPPDVPKESHVAIYGRVSSHDQKVKGDLARQIASARDFCQRVDLEPHYIFHDISSGLNARRAGLRKLCRLIEQGQIRKVVITYPDRLTRFGFEYLRQYLHSHGAEILVMQQPPTSSMQEELVQDLIAIITSFSGRVHGMRSHRKSRSRQQGIRSPT